jgi:two-component system, LytTR family, sensor kinase
MRARDWVVIAGTWSALALLSVGTLIEQYQRENGYRIDPRDLAVGRLLDVAIWLAMLPALFSGIDRIRAGMSSLARQAAACAGVLAIAVAASAVANWGLLHLIGPYVARDPGVLATDIVSLRSQASDALDGITAPILIYIIMAYVVRRRERDRNAAAATAALRAATLHALTIELQPHFLFNTLNAIAALVRTDPRDAERMIVQLSDLLRLTLAAGSQERHTLATELAHLERYLALQQMRFGNRLTVRTEIDESLREMSVPTMVLQPLVENALSHGLGPKPGPGTLTIEARRSNGAVELVVTDDGVGPIAAARDGTGLSNTRQRLALLYQGAGALTIAPRAGGGTVARVRIPAEDAT